ncbi:hypothetical protein IZY60_13645 [Lutibacter sp. B2]|nr:hypothetical protein [Lutibacter sp. B2]
MKKMYLTKILSLNETLNKKFIIDISIDSKGKILLLTQEKKIEYTHSNYYRDHLYDHYDVYEIENNTLIHNFRIENKNVDFDFVRNIDDHNYLLSSSRFHSEDNIEQNAIIITKNGDIKNKLLLGDGIQDIKIEDSNIIWTSYFDEGIFGDYGCLGAPGLRSWDLCGESLYEYDARDEAYGISDCYAFNIDKNFEKWFYFYTEFYLCRLHENSKRYFTMDVAGAKILVLGNGYVLTDLGYNGRYSYVIQMETPKGYKSVLTFSFFDSVSQKKLKPSNTQFCDNKLVMLSGQNIYKVEIEDVMNEFNII